MSISLPHTRSNTVESNESTDSIWFSGALDGPVPPEPSSTMSGKSRSVNHSRRNSATGLAPSHAVMLKELSLASRSQSDMIHSSPISQPTLDFSSIPMASMASPHPLGDNVDIPSVSPLTDGMLSKMDLGKLWRWILCICTVNFDLDKGQDLEFVYPPLEFTNEEKKTLAFSSFPDSNTSEHVGDNIFTFRTKLPECAKRMYVDQLPPPVLESKETPLGLPLHTDGYVYGYVFFRQRRDKTRKRGYFQKSLLILSPHPWIGLFRQVMGILGPMFMEIYRPGSVYSNSDALGPVNVATCMPLFEAACFNFMSWAPPPSCHLSNVHTFSQTKLTLPFLGVALFTSLPSAKHLPQFSEKRIDPVTGEDQDWILGCRVGLYQIFSQNLDQLWLMWELMVLGEPLLVMGDTPTVCGDMVWALLELIKPIPFGGEFRPYFTIQDPDFKLISARNRPAPASTVIGATNLVFTKVMDHWPNMFSVTRSCQQTNSNSVSRFNQGQIGSRAATITNRGRIADTDFVYTMSITTKHKPYLSKDRNILKMVTEMTLRGAKADAVDDLLQRHFVELTDRFLQPLNRYFDGLLVGSPLDMNLSNLRSKPEINPFRQETFLKNLEASLPTLPVTSKRPLVDLYRTFLKSSNFGSWLQTRINDINREWRIAYLRVLATKDIQSWTREKISQKHDVECIDLFLRIQDELAHNAPFFDVESRQIRFKDIPGLPDTASSFSDAYWDMINSPSHFDPNVKSPIRAMREEERPVTPASSNGNGAKSTPPSPLDLGDIKNYYPVTPDRVPQSPRYKKAPFFDSKSSKLNSNPSLLHHTLTNRLGGIVPTPDQYARLIEQSLLLLKCLPDDLGASLMAKFL